MKTIRSLCVLMAAGWLTGSVALGQQPYEPIYPAPSPFAPPTEYAPEPVPARTGLSDWIRYQRDCCEGTHGRLTPLYTELYFGGGASFPIAKGTSDLSHELQTGWTLMGGARALLFNEEMTRAWVFDLHIINIHQYTGAHNRTFPLTVFQNGVPVTSGVTANGNGVGTEPNFNLEDMNRTMVGLGFGREWYLWQPADFDGLKWRIGLDGGGRYGTERLNVVNSARSAHTTDVVEGAYLALRSDLEVPCGNVLFQAGLRLEWAYTFSDILQQDRPGQSNMQDLTLLFTIGARY
jgi:hypothetical protein